MDKYEVMAYKSAIEREKEKLEPQKAWLEKIGVSFEKAVKNGVANYFSHILCQFKEDCYNEALKEENE